MKHISRIVYQKCCGCKGNLRNKYLKRNVRRVNQDNILKIRSYFRDDSIDIGNYVCNKCQKLVKKNARVFTKTPKPNYNANSMSVNYSENDNEPIFEESAITNVDKTKNSNKTVLLPTAYTSHKKCLVCYNDKGLHRVKPESIMNAYLNHGLIIKNGARCCDDHLDSNDIIKDEEYNHIITKDMTYDKDFKLVLDACLEASKKINYFLKDSSGIFDKFKNLATLDETLCYKITGWTKEQFANFSKLIKRVRDTCGRTKEQLVAIYRYWLAKGIDQCTLAMLKSNTSQQQISHYLAQIREAMNEDIVPLYLGAKKEKEFFLSHNTESVKTLHKLADDVLAVIIDGTYTRLEKSSNNDFQYLSYSMHKSQNLVKPFIICCADGYFIDCYGPFQANLNDAQIFKYILDTDKDLKVLFTPKEKIIMFLDRGIIVETNIQFYF